MDSSLSTTWRIEEDTVEYCFCVDKVFSRIHLHSLNVGGSLETDIVNELVIAYLILFYRGDSSSILYHRRYLCCLGTRGCADIEDRLTRCWCKREHWEHRCDRLEIYLPVVEFSGSLDGVLMHPIEYINSLDSVKSLCYDSLFFKFFEYVTTISSECIDTKRASPPMKKGIYNSVIIITEYDTET